MRMTLEARLTDSLQAQVLPRGEGCLRVCLVIPQSGALGIVGPSALGAALLAAHEINAAGGVLGRYVDLVLVDGGQAPMAVAREVERLGAAGAIDVVTGFHTSDVHRAVELVAAGRTPYVFTPPHEGGRRRRGVVCTGVEPVQQLRASVRWLSHLHGVRKWALIGNDYIWPAAVHGVARRLVMQNAGHVVLERRVPLGDVSGVLDRLVDDLRRSRADAALLSLVGRDLATFNVALSHSGLDRRIVRLSGALEENGLMASGGDDTGLLYASMSSFASLQDDRRLALAERHRTVLGPQAPVLDTYAEGVYEGVQLVAALATEGSLTVERAGAATRRILTSGALGAVGGSGRPRVHLARATGMQFEVVAHPKVLPIGSISS